MKTKNLLAGLFPVLFWFGLAGADVKYPNPVGHVNDFARVLPVDTAKKLETELRTYKEQTGDKNGIEIVVVTVPSLEGLSVEEYTIGLAKKWGVGAKKKDNGVVLLVAPNERKVKIEVGYGLESDLTDSQVGRVIRDQIIPLFKEGRMADGVVAGVAGILQQLGEKPYQERLQERLEERKNAPLDKKSLSLWVIVLIAIIIIVIIFWVVIAVMESDNHSSGDGGYSSGGFIWSSGSSSSSDGGGGFGGFGGGGFGGGGASGSW